MLRSRTTRRLTAISALSVMVVSTAALSLPSYAAGGDRDRDGMPNRWESRHGLDPNRADADRDRDRDGLRNLSEYRKHADPRDEDSDGDGHDDGDEVHDDSSDTRLHVQDSDDDGVLDGDDDSDGNDIADEDEDDATETCRRDDDDRDRDNVADEDENELGGDPRSGDFDGDDIPDGDEDLDEDGESDEDGDDSEGDRCDDSTEDRNDLLGTIASYDLVTRELVVETSYFGVVTYVVTDDTEIEFDSSGSGSGREGTEADLRVGWEVIEVDLEKSDDDSDDSDDDDDDDDSDDDSDDEETVTRVLEEIELAREG